LVDSRYALNPPYKKHCAASGGESNPKRLNGNPVRTKHLFEMAGLIMFSPSMMATKSAQRCWRTGRKKAACGLSGEQVNLRFEEEAK